MTLEEYINSRWCIYTNNRQGYDAGGEIWTGDSVMCINKELNECVKGFFCGSWAHKNASNYANAFLVYSGTSRKKELLNISTNKYRRVYNRDTDINIYMADYDFFYPKYFITSRNYGYKAMIVPCRVVIFEKCVFFE